MRWASEQQPPPRSTYMGAALTLALVACAARASADGAIDAWASWALAPKVWKGQTVPAPEPEVRPAGALTQLDSYDLPLHVHVPRQSGERRALRVVKAGEAALVTLNALSWPLPGVGSEGALDLYLVPRERCAGACAAISGPSALSDFDAAESYALLSADLPASELDACAQSALAQAGLRAVDPSEAASWARASAELSVWLTLGQLGCDGSLAAGQSAPERGLLDADPRSAAAGALLLGVLSERVDASPTPGTWLRNLWESTRQRSRGLVAFDRLRSSPDLWEVLRQTLEAQHLALEDELIEFAVARYFAGPAPRRAQAPYRLFGALPSDAAVPVSRELSAGDLPAHLHDLPLLRSLGSSYVRVHLPPAARRHELQVWLRGELGPHWSLTAVRLDASGRELGRTAAPARNVPNSFVPVALDDETSEVVLVIVNLPEGTPDADIAPGVAHGYELIVGLI